MASQQSDVEVYTGERSIASRAYGDLIAVELSVRWNLENLRPPEYAPPTLVVGCCEERERDCLQLAKTPQNRGGHDGFR